MKIPWMEEHSSLQSMDSQKVKHNRATSLASKSEIHLKEGICVTTELFIKTGCKA